jgi:hypothetical protein
MERGSALSEDSVLKALAKSDRRRSRKEGHSRGRSPSRAHNKRKGRRRDRADRKPLHSRRERARSRSPGYVSRHKVESEDRGRQILVLKLKAVEGPFKGIKFDIDEGGAKVGRMEIPTPTYLKKVHELHLPDKDVSRKHAQIEWDGPTGAYWVRDLGSTNGFSINGVKTDGRRALGAGDTLGLGKSVFEIRLKELTVYRWQEQEARCVVHNHAHTQTLLQVPVPICALPGIIAELVVWSLADLFAGVLQRSGARPSEGTHNGAQAQPHW